MRGRGRDSISHSHSQVGVREGGGREGDHSKELASSPFIVQGTCRARSQHATGNNDH